jgi:hypothetical protein
MTELASPRRSEAAIARDEAAAPARVDVGVSTAAGLRTAAQRLAGWWPAGLATGLVILVCLKAIMSIDLTWDSMAYHMPFAALRAGLMTPWQLQWAPEDSVGWFYRGFPILADLVCGWMWRLSGRPEAINLLGIVCTLLLLAYLRWAFRLGGAWIVIGLLAIPAFQTAVAGAYVDVPASVIFTILVLSICDLWANPERFVGPARWIVMFLAAFAAANMKMQTAVCVCLMLPLLVPPVWRLLRSHRAGWRAAAGAGFLALTAGGLIAVNLIKNAIVYHNPLYPVAIRIAGIDLPGPLQRNAYLTVGRTYEHLPNWLQWVRSVLEYHAFDGRYIPYTNGMGDLPLTSPANSMGGFFAALVVASLCFFVIGLRANPAKVRLPFVLVFAWLTGICAVLPNSEELRYDLFWMMFLVISCLLMLQHPAARAYLTSYKIMLIAALVFVTSITGGTYLHPHWGPAQAYAEATGSDRLLRAAVTEPGQVVCLEQGAGHWDNRWTVVFSPIFHRQLASELPYAIRQGGCGALTKIPPPSH